MEIHCWKKKTYGDLLQQKIPMEKLIAKKNKTGNPWLEFTSDSEATTQSTSQLKR